MVIIILTVYAVFVLVVGLFGIPYFEKADNTGFEDSTKEKIIAMQLLKIVEIAAISLFVVILIFNRLLS